MMSDTRGQSLLLRMRVDPTPWHDDPPTAPIFYQALGVQLVAWARFEGHFVTALVQLIGLVHEIIPLADMPLAWEKRADFWKKAFRALPSLAPVRDDALALITDIVKAARDRGILAHSAWGHFLSVDPPSLELTSIKFESGGILATGNIKLTLATLQHLTLVANTLTARLVPISGFLSGLRGPPPENAQLALRPKESLTTPRPQPKNGSKQRQKPDRQR